MDHNAFLTGLANMRWFRQAQPGAQMGRKSHPHKQPQKQGPAKSWNGPVSVALARLAFAARAGDAQRVANAMIQRGELAADGPFLDKHIPLSALIYTAWDLGVKNNSYGLQQQYCRLLFDHSLSRPAIEHIASLAESIMSEESVIEQLAQEVTDIAVDDKSAEIVLERTEFDLSSYGRSTGHGYDLSAYGTLGDFLDQPAEGREATFESGHGFAAPTVSDPIEEMARNIIYEALHTAAEKAVLNAPPELRGFFRLAVGNKNAYDDFVIEEGYEALSRNNCDEFDLMRTVGAMDFCQTVTKLRPDALDRLKRDMACRHKANIIQEAMPHDQKILSAPVPRTQPRKTSGQQHVTQILSLVGDRHWSHIFPNPQLGTRQLEAYLGPTNSGKTYQALQALQSLKPHERGVYLAPLRLLAIEVCEELRSQGVAASLVTGEERDIDPQARVVCSTIEMLDPVQHYTVGVIDEMQMIADRQRGWAWTQALFEMSADRLFVLGSPSVESLLKDFAETTGDALTLHRTRRFNPLQVKPQPIAPKSVQPGTIYVVFSRNSVIRWGEYFRGNGHSVAQIYGAMPPEVRREEARRFRTGEADILVATDAVAMGLNLPAHTVVLGEGEKYNGQTSTAVPKPLVRQIAGRAGRYGHHDAGFAAGADSGIHRHLQSALQGQDDAFTFPLPNVAPTRHWIAAVMEETPDITVRDLLTAWQQTVKGSPWFRCVDLSEILEKAHVLDGITGSDRLPMAERLQILTAPADIRAGQMHHFRTMVSAIVENRTLSSPASGAGPHARTEDLESAYKHLSLYCWFHYRYPQSFPEIGKAVSERSRCVDQLITHIRQGLKRHCKSCGKVLPAKGTYGICESCYQAQRRQRQWDRDDDYH